MSFAMDYSRLGETDLTVSRLGYGASALGNMYTPVTDEEAARSVSVAMEEYGINYFDTAPSYGLEGLSETRLGKALAGKRHKVVLNTKCGRYDHWGDGRFEFTYEPKRMRLEVENSLRRLQTDYIDVLQIHDAGMRIEAEYIIQETMPELVKLKEEGKIRYIGVSGKPLDYLKKVADTCSDHVDVMLTFGDYCLREQNLEAKFAQLTEKKRYGIVNSSVTFMGFITKKGKGVIGMKGPIKDRLEACAEEANALCEAAGTELGELAVKFGFDCEHCADSTLISMSRESRVRQNAELYFHRKEYDPELAEKVKAIMARSVGKV